MCGRDLAGMTGHQDCVVLQNIIVDTFCEIFSWLPLKDDLLTSNLVDSDLAESPVPCWTPLGVPNNELRKLKMNG